MPADYLAWRTQIRVDYDPRRPDVSLTEKDYEDAEHGCPDCPKLKNNGKLPVFIQEGTQGRIATILCDQLEPYGGGMGMSRGCAETKDYCTIHGIPVSIGDHGTFAPKVFDSSPVEAKFDDQERMREVEQRDRLEALTREELEALSEATAKDCLLHLHKTIAGVERIRQRGRTASIEEQRLLTRHLLSLDKRASTMSGSVT